MLYKRFIISALCAGFFCTFIFQSCSTLMYSSASSAANTTRMIQAAGATATALALTDAQVAELCQKSVQEMDAKSKIADSKSKYTIRLNKLTKNLTSVNSTKLNFKVYITTDINAFACADGSIRVYSGLMDVMNDEELTAIIGHEMGHIAGADTKDAMRQSYLTYAALQALGTTGNVMATLTSSQLGEIAQSFIGARYSQKQEYAADEYGFNVAIKQGKSKYAMSNALNKLVSLSNGAQSSAIEQMFASHPNSAKRAAKMKAKADALK